MRTLWHAALKVTFLIYKDSCSWLRGAAEKWLCWKWEVEISNSFTSTGNIAVNLLLFHNWNPVNSDMLSLTGCWVCRIFPRSLLLFSHTGKKGVIMTNNLFVICIKHQLPCTCSAYTMPLFTRRQKTGGQTHKTLCTRKSSMHTFPQIYEAVQGCV